MQSAGFLYAATIECRCGSLRIDAEGFCKFTVLLSSMWGIEVAQVKAAASSVNSSLIILSREKGIDHTKKPTDVPGMWQCGMQW